MGKESLFSLPRYYLSLAVTDAERGGLLNVCRVNLSDRTTTVETTEWIK